MRLNCHMQKGHCNRHNEYAYLSTLLLAQRAANVQVLALGSSPFRGLSSHHSMHRHNQLCGILLYTCKVIQSALYVTEAIVACMTRVH